MARDKVEVLIANFGPNRVAWAIKTQDPALVLVAIEYIRHDIMFAEVTKVLGPEKVEALGSALVTFLPWVLPLMVLSRIELPEWGIRWLNYVPICVMAALVGQELLVQDRQFHLLNYVELLAAIPTVLVAMRTKSLLGTVIAGMVSIMALRYFL